MKDSHPSPPLPADLAAVIAEGGGIVENVEIVEAFPDEFNGFNEFNAATLPERVHAIPEDSILADVRDIARDFSEAPDSFTIAPFIALIGGVLTPRCYWDFGGKKFPNVFQFVVGPPGIRKSTSFKVAEMVGKAALISDNFHSGNASDSAAFAKWQKQPHRIQIESEGNTLVTSWRGSYSGKEIAARMLKLYDGDGWEQTFRYQEDKDGDGAEQRIECATVSLAIGATPGVCRFDGVDAKNGLRRRLGYYAADRPAREIDWPRKINDDDLADIVKAVERIAGIEGRFNLNGEAMDEWSILQQRVRSDSAEIGRDSSEEAEIRLAELAETPSRILKLSGIFQVCRWAKGNAADPLTVDAGTLRLAIAHQYACLDASRAVDSIAHRSAIDDEAEKVLDTILSEARDPNLIGRWTIEGNVIRATKSDITRRFAPNGSRGQFNSHRLHAQVMPLVIRKAKGTTERREAGATVYAIPMEREP